MRIRLLSAAAGLLAASGAFGYYHFLHYGSTIAPIQAIPEKFQLSALTDGTVRYHISEDGPSAYAELDGFAKVVSQIRAAAKVWNDVETSALRLRFDGVMRPGSNDTAATPSINVVFEDLPPGVNGYGGPTVRNEVVTTPDGALVPIQRSVVVLAKSMVNRPSWTEAYFLTAVHEFGHALGLQHSFVSGAMATEITRATTKIRPILPDDVAGLSLLYPAPGFAESLGAISGRVVNTNGVPQAMASVVAVAPGGAAVGTLTHPDGTFRIAGIPPGQYFLYAHPLPSAQYGEATPGNIVFPVDSAGTALPAGSPFATTFYPGTRLPQTAIVVEGSKTMDSLELVVATRSTIPSLHSVTTYSFPGQRAVKPAHIYTNGGRNLVVMTGQGLITGGQPAAGLSIQAISGSVSAVPGGLRPYAPAPDYYLEADFQFGLLAGEGPVHLLFLRGEETYVLPYGLRVADRSAPQIETMTDADNGIVTLTGPGLRADSRIHFDGATAQTLGYSEESGSLSVRPPYLTPGSPAHVTAFSTDGQSSLFLQAPFVYTSGEAAAAAAPALAWSARSLPAGTESLVEISRSDLASGAQLGLGTPDLAVRGAWTPAPGKLLVNVRAARGAAGRVADATLVQGVRLEVEREALRITDSAATWISVDAGPEGGLVPGQTATLRVYETRGDAVVPAEVRINGQAVPLIEGSGDRATFLVPESQEPGIVTVIARTDRGDTLPLAVPAVKRPVLVTAITGAASAAITADRAAAFGEILTISVSGLPEVLKTDGATPVIRLTVGGVEHKVLSLTRSGSVWQFQIVLETLVTPGPQALHLDVEGIPVRPATLIVAPR